MSDDTFAKGEFVYYVGTPGIVASEYAVFEDNGGPNVAVIGMSGSAVPVAPGIHILPREKLARNRRRVKGPVYAEVPCIGRSDDALTMTDWPVRPEAEIPRSEDDASSGVG